MPELDEKDCLVIVRYISELDLWVIDGDSRRHLQQAAESHLRSHPFPRVLGLAVTKITPAPQTPVPPQS